MRALRNSVIHRKVSDGFRSDAGAEAHAVVSSVVDTARKQRGNEDEENYVMLMCCCSFVNLS